ncbi:hypothetical protein F5Y00DRAFT_263939 [Daldinia vernicosa]|uniref:uncharacterized protein n=1 Tax=Daldinia vernicosa TaxID=114800 RepID=UPI0020082860|nr:uncharacterized protein F5Y00DRAFT_263939 [Daldinia vernicosa]KAI0847126.1 hypothetical protein F5Y00DRAFT_263939 [Daldinia vernicosa]
MSNIQQQQRTTDILIKKLDQLENVIGNISKAWEYLWVNTPGPDQAPLGHVIAGLRSKQLDIQNLKSRVSRDKSNYQVEPLIRRVAYFVRHARHFAQTVNTRSRMSNGTHNTVARHSEAANSPVYIKSIYEAVFADWGAMLRAFDEVYPARPPTGNLEPHQSSSHGTLGVPMDTSRHSPPPLSPPPQITYYFPWPKTHLYTGGSLL